MDIRPLNYGKSQITQIIYGIIQTDHCNGANVNSF